MKTPLLTALALCAFAANSVLCRLALGQDSIDAASFTIVRMISGAVVLALILTVRTRGRFRGVAGSWLSSLMLFAYAIAFSYAYLSLDTGTGALILFGSVQITMIVIAFFSGSRLLPVELAGVAVAFAGLIYLLLPGASAPSIDGFLLMAAAGSAWGIYTLRGRGSEKPLQDTAFNFLRAVPFTIILLLVTAPDLQLSLQGILLAVLSGGLASGVGYTIWYTALGGLSAVQAAVVQLSVPVIAALGGVVLVSEQITGHLIISGLLVLGGILLVIVGRSKTVTVKD